MPVLINEETREVYAWEEELATVGRTSDNTVRIPLPGISRNHCQIARRGVHYTLLDLGSKNGTILNENLMATKELLLQPGDVVGLGKRRLRFDLAAPEGLVSRESQDGAPGQEPIATIEHSRETIEYGKESASLPRQGGPPPGREVSTPAAPVSKGQAPKGKAPDGKAPEGQPVSFVDESAVISKPPGLLGPSDGDSTGIPMKQEKGTGEILCPKCGGSNLSSSQVCWNCQTVLPKGAPPEVVPESQRAFGGACPKCQTTYPAGAIACGECGLILGDRRAVVGSSSRVLREELFWLATGIAAVLVVIGAVSYYLYAKRSQVAGGTDAGMYKVRLERAEAAFVDAQKKQENQRHERAFALYKEAEELASDVIHGLAEDEEPEIRRLAEEALDRFSTKRESCEEWLEENREHLEGEKALRKEREEQLGLGRAFFHGGWIAPGDAGLVFSGERTLFPEEEALGKALAKEGNSDEELDALLQAFLRRAWAFQEKFYLRERFWTPHRGLLPLPEPIATGARGTTYPEGVSGDHFPGVYLARITFSASGAPPRGTMEWDKTEGALRIVALLHDSTAEAEAASKAKGIVTLSHNAKLVSSRATSTFTLPCSPDDYSHLSDLIKEGTPPVLQALVKVTSVHEEATSREILHALADGAKFSQSLKHHQYTLGFTVIQSCWSRPSPGDKPAYLPLFFEKEPPGGLYQIARKALGIEE